MAVNVLMLSEGDRLIAGQIRRAETPYEGLSESNKCHKPDPSSAVVYCRKWAAFIFQTQVNFVNVPSCWVNIAYGIINYYIWRKDCLLLKQRISELNKLQTVRVKHKSDNPKDRSVEKS